MLIQHIINFIMLNNHLLFYMHLLKQYKEAIKFNLYLNIIIYFMVNYCYSLKYFNYHHLLLHHFI